MLMQQSSRAHKIVSAFLTYIDKEHLKMYVFKGFYSAKN